MVPLIYTSNVVFWQRIITFTHLLIGISEIVTCSLITLNVRLNNDFKGGGTYLPRYQKTLQPKKSGNAMAHPGSITHKHGGRPVEEGTRYILVTFTQTPK